MEVDVSSSTAKCIISSTVSAEGFQPAWRRLAKSCACRRRSSAGSGARSKRARMGSAGKVSRKIRRQNCVLTASAMSRAVPAHRRSKESVWADPASVPLSGAEVTVRVPPVAKVMMASLHHLAREWKFSVLFWAVSTVLTSAPLGRVPRPSPMSFCAMRSKARACSSVVLGGMEMRMLGMPKVSKKASHAMTLWCLAQIRNMAGRSMGRLSLMMTASRFISSGCGGTASAFSL